MHVLSVRHQSLVHQRQIDCNSCLQLHRASPARNWAFVPAPTAHWRLPTHRVHHTGHRAAKHQQLQHRHPAEHRQADQHPNVEKPTTSHWQTIYYSCQNEPKLATSFKMPWHTNRPLLFCRCVMYFMYTVGLGKKRAQNVLHNIFY